MMMERKDIRREEDVAANITEEEPDNKHNDADNINIIILVTRNINLTNEDEPDD